MMQRFDEGFIRVLHAGIFADDGDRDGAVRIANTLGDRFPFSKIGLRRNLHIEMFEQRIVEAGFVISERRFVDVRQIARFDDVTFAHVAEQANLAALFARNRPIATAEDDVRLNADRAQLLHGVLRRLSFHLPRGRDVRQQREMDKSGRGIEFVAQLADGFEERQALNVADRAADFAQHEISVAVI